MSIKIYFYLFFSFCLFVSCKDLNQKKSFELSNTTQEKNSYTIPKRARIYKVEEDSIFKELKSPLLRELLKEADRYMSQTVYQPFPCFFSSFESILIEILNCIVIYNKIEKKLINLKETSYFFLEIKKQIKKLRLSQDKLEDKELNKLIAKILKEETISLDEKNKFDQLIEKFIDKVSSLIFIEFLPSFFNELNSKSFKLLLIKIMRVQLVRLKNLEYSLKEHSKKLQLTFFNINSLNIDNSEISLLKISEFENKLSPKTREKYVFPSLNHLINFKFQEEEGNINNKKIIKFILMQFFIQRNFKDRSITSLEVEESIDLEFNQNMIELINNLSSNLGKLKVCFEDIEVQGSYLNDNISKNIQGFIDFLNAPKEKENSFRETLYKNFEFTKNWILVKARWL